LELDESTSCSYEPENGREGGKFGADGSAESSYHLAISGPTLSKSHKHKYSLFFILF
jgi:hypothetical protein